MGNKNKDKGVSPVYAFGGALSGNGADWTNGITVIGNGGTHEQNPFEGVQMGVAPDGTPNLVEEGEVVWKDYVFSKRIKVPDKIKEKYKLKGEDLTFADAAQFMQKSSAERPNDPIAKRTLDANLGGLVSEQEVLRQKREAKKAKYAGGGKLTSLRYIPALGSAIGVATDLFGLTNKPDYSNADLLLTAANEAASGVSDVAFEPVGNYLTYKPFDRMFYANQLAAQAAATRRAIRNNSNGNRATAIAGLLGADYNAQTQLGNLFRRADELDLTQRKEVEGFNRATNEFNTEGFLKAAMANADNYARRANIRISAAEKAAALKDAIDARASAAKSANLTNLFDSLGAIGEDELNRQDARWLAPLVFGAGADRAPSLRGLWEANGSKINKRKKGLTYG